jgi:hypothetical protein
VTGLRHAAETRVTSPAPRDVWRRVLAADPDAVATQTPEWLDCLCAGRGYTDASRLYELPDGRALVLPLAATTRAGVRIAEQSWPYGWGYGGVLTDGGRPAAADVRLVLADLARRPVLRTAVVPMPLSAGVWTGTAPRRARRVPYLTQVLDLDGGFAAVWSRRYRPSARSAVRRAERSGLEIRREHGGAVVGDFAALYAESVDRWARRQGRPLWLARLLARRSDPPGRLRAATGTLGEACVIWSAYRAGEPVAVSVVLRHGRHSIGWLSAMSRERVGRTGAGYLLESLAIEEACTAGCRVFHLGESEAGSAVEHHKTQFGATPVRYAALRFERLPTTAAEHRLRAAVRTMTDRRGGAA